MGLVGEVGRSFWNGPKYGAVLSIGACESKMAVIFRSNDRRREILLKMAEVKINQFRYSRYQVEKYSLTGIDAVLKWT